MTALPRVALPDGVTLLDGGMGQELRRRGVPDPDGLWAASGLTEAPDAVRAIHLDYIAAGARVITTNSYSTTRSNLARGGRENEFEALNTLAGELAARARAESGSEVLIAGALPPIAASYRPDLVGPFEEIEPAYREQAEILAPHVDLFLCETMSSGAEALAAASAAASTGKPVWVAWTLRDHGDPHLRSGETVAQAAAALAELPVSAYLANCCAPESITRAMADLVALGPVPAGGYANGFDHVPAQWQDNIAALGKRDDLDPDGYAAHVQKWLDAGARIIGGCCETGPAHIARLKELID